MDVQFSSTFLTREEFELVKDDPLQIISKAELALAKKNEDIKEKQAEIDMQGMHIGTYIIILIIIW